MEKIEPGILTIAELDEAITPRVYTSIADDGAPPLSENGRVRPISKRRQRRRWHLP